MPPYGPRDPAEDLRIVRQSLLSTVGRLYNKDPKTPQEAIDIARIWEAYVYEPAPPFMPATEKSGNGAYAPAPAGVPMCAECGAALTPVSFKKGNTWPVEQLAQQGIAKYGKALCKTHYFGKKTTA